MKEARVECLIPEFKIDDLGLSLTRGDVAWVSEAKARASSRLKHARAIGAVDVRWEERYTVAKDRIPPRRKRQTRPAVRPSRVATTSSLVEVSPPPAVPALGPEEMRRIAREEAHGALRGTVAAEVRKALADSPTLTQGDVEAALRNVLGASVPVPTVGGQRVAAVEDEPVVFIPSDLGQTDAKVEIVLEATETTSDGFDEAAAALKAVTRKRKRRKREDAE